MVSKATLQKFVDEHIDQIGEILPGGLKTKEGKWLLVCPMMERFELDFSKVVLNKAEEVKDVEVEDKPKKSKKGKKKA